MKITHRQLSQIIKEELSSIRESLPYDKATVFDVWKKGPWVSAHGGQSRGPEDGEPMGRVRVSSPQYASELMHTLGQHGFDAGKIKPIYDNDGDNVVDWDEFIQLISDLSGQAEEAPGVADSPAGLGGETYEKTAADYKKHPEWFNEGKIKITRKQLRQIIKEELLRVTESSMPGTRAYIDSNGYLQPPLHWNGEVTLQDLEEARAYLEWLGSEDILWWKGFDDAPGDTSLGRRQIQGAIECTELQIEINDWPATYRVTCTDESNPTVTSTNTFWHGMKWYREERPHITDAMNQARSQQGVDAPGRTGISSDMEPN